MGAPAALAGSLESGATDATDFAAQATLCESRGDACTVDSALQWQRTTRLAPISCLDSKAESCPRLEMGAGAVPVAARGDGSDDDFEQPQRATTGAACALAPGALISTGVISRVAHHKCTRPEMGAGAATDAMVTHGDGSDDDFERPRRAATGAACALARAARDARSSPDTPGQEMGAGRAAAEPASRAVGTWTQAAATDVVLLPTPEGASDSMRARIDEINAERLAVAAQAATAERAARARERNAGHMIAAEAAIESCLERLLAESVGEAMASWRNRPNAQRSAASKRRRRRRSTPSGGSGSGSAAAADGGGEAGPAGGAPQTPREAALLERALTAERALKGRSEVLALTRTQLKRETKTAKLRWQQLARRGAKAQKKLSRKLFAKRAGDVAAAARRENERVRKRKQPEGDVLHSSERKHQRLLAKGGGVNGGGPGGGRGGKGGREGGGRGGGKGSGRGSGRRGGKGGGPGCGGSSGWGWGRGRQPGAC